MTATYLQTAHYTIQVDFTKHGSELFCSHEQCRNEGIKFLYCAYCKVPVAKKSFYSRHRHDEEEGKKPELKGEKREEMKVAAPNEAKFPAQPDESGVPLQVTLTRTKSDKKKKKKRKSRSASKREQRCGSSDKKRKTTSHSSSSESSSASSRSSLSREASSANMNAEGKTDRAGPAAAASDTPYEQFRNTPVLKNWENLLFHRPPTEAADQMSEWLMGVLSVSANFRELVDTGLATTTTPRSEGNGQAHPSGNDNGRNCSSSESYSSGSNSDDCAK